MANVNVKKNGRDHFAMNLLDVLKDIQFETVCKFYFKIILNSMLKHLLKIIPSAFEFSIIATKNLLRNEKNWKNTHLFFDYKKIQLKNEFDEKKTFLFHYQFWKMGYRCSPNRCYHDGVLSVGSTKIECRCPAPWDGQWCERLACWRKAAKGNSIFKKTKNWQFFLDHERRWRNAGDHCECVDGFSGESCETITKCKNGELKNNHCHCAEGWKGELCERECKPGQTCSAPGLFFGIFAAIAPVIGAIFFRLY